jgi:hypothetical protein
MGPSTITLEASATPSPFHKSNNSDDQASESSKTTGNHNHKQWNAEYVEVVIVSSNRKPQKDGSNDHNAKRKQQPNPPLEIRRVKWHRERHAIIRQAGSTPAGLTIHFPKAYALKEHLCFRNAQVAHHNVSSPFALKVFTFLCLEFCRYCWRVAHSALPPGWSTLAIFASVGHSSPLGQMSRLWIITRRQSWR